MAQIWLLALALAQAFDYTSFLVMVRRHGITAEMNPIVLGIVNETGMTGLTIAKIASVAVLGSLAVIFGRRHPKMAAALLVFGIVAGLLGGVTNVATL